MQPTTSLKTFPGISTGNDSLLNKFPHLKQNTQQIIITAIVLSIISLGTILYCEWKYRTISAAISYLVYNPLISVLALGILCMGMLYATVHHRKSIRKADLNANRESSDPELLTLQKDLKQARKTLREDQRKLDQYSSAHSTLQRELARLDEEHQRLSTSIGSTHPSLIGISALVQMKQIEINGITPFLTHAQEAIHLSRQTIEITEKRIAQQKRYLSSTHN